MAINIVILLICVMLLIIVVCILSYLKIVFERLLDNEEKTRNMIQPDSFSSIKNTLNTILSLVQNLNEDIERIEKVLLTRYNSMGKSTLSKECGSFANKNKDGECNSEIANNNNGNQLTNVNVIAYKDACTAFQKINNELYSIRIFTTIVHALFNILYIGSGEFASEILNELSDSDREKVVAIWAKIKSFNENYRFSLERGLKALGTSFESSVRFPLNQPFDNSWDENILGYDIEDGTIIKRVVSLGYDFPNSQIIGKQKTKVM